MGEVASDWSSAARLTRTSGGGRSLVSNLLEEHSRSEESGDWEKSSVLRDAILVLTKGQGEGAQPNVRCRRQRRRRQRAQHITPQRDAMRQHRDIHANGHCDRRDLQARLRR